MKNLILMIMVGAMLMFSSEAVANYLIELKSGRSIVTSYYWEENGQIMFYQLGGVVGYPADQVERVTDTDQAELQETPGAEYGSETHPEQQAEDFIDQQGLIITDTDAEEAEQLQNELKKLHQERVIMVERYYSAMRDDLHSTMNESRERIQELHEKQENLREQVQDIYGDLPQWWFDITGGS